MSEQVDTRKENAFDETAIHKTILVGDSGVGKTSFLVQFDQKKFHPASFAATVGIGFTNKTVTVAGVKVKLQIWDTAGQERFRSISHAYYRDAHALFLLYDVTNKTSFNNISAWLAEINEFARDDVVIILIGNKADLTGQKEVRKEDGEAIARQFGVEFFETSAKTASNVALAFETIAGNLYYQKTRQATQSSRAPLNIQPLEHQTINMTCCS